MSLKRALISRINQLPFLYNRIYTVRYGPARGLKRQGGLGWLPAFVPRFHEWGAEETFLEQINWAGLTVYDVGGDQGILTLFFAKRVGPVGQVITFEPNPRSHQRILTNVGLNEFQHVRVLPYGLGQQAASLAFTFPEAEPARGSADPMVRTELGKEQNARFCVIEVKALDDAIRDALLPPPDFIKLDVEGMEWDALCGMRETLSLYRPRLFIEIHGISSKEKTENAVRVVSLLEDGGYRIRHVESGRPISKEQAPAAARGHLYCE